MIAPKIWFIRSLAVAMICSSGLSITAHSAKAYEALNTKTNLRAVYFLPLEDRERVHVQLIINAGEADAEGPEGVAHYLEHLVQWQSVGDIDVRPLHHTTNAYTNTVVTNYLAAGRPEQLSELISQVAGVLIRPSQSSAFLLREREVVVQEYTQRVAENIPRQLYGSLARVLFDGHALSRSVMGTPASIRRINSSQALRYFDRFYNPANATLVVTGKAHSERVIREIERNFSRFQQAQPAPRHWRRFNQWLSGSSTVSKKYKLAQRPQTMLLDLFDISGIRKVDAVYALETIKRNCSDKPWEGFPIR